MTTPMDAQTRLKLTIGDLIMQLALAHEEIEKLKAEKEPKPEQEAEVVNFLNR